MRTIRGRKAIVTGAASGIGRAVALALAAEGADLYLIDRDETGLASVAREAADRGVAVLSATCDLSIPAHVSAAVSRLLARWNTVHVVVNCAGIACYGPFHLTTEDAWRKTIAVNLLAPMQIIHELLPTLLAAEQAHILNVCSFMGLVPTRRVPAYQSSKFGLVGFTLALRNDYHCDDFGVTALCPGFVRTPMLDHVRDPETHKPPPRPPAFMSTTPEAVAAAAIAAIRRNRGLVVVPFTARLAWWLTRLCPALAGWVGRQGWRRRHRVMPERN